VVVLGAALGPIKGKQSGENILFHRLPEPLDRDDVVLADRDLGSYWEIALLRGLNESKGSDPNGTTLRAQHVVFPVA
jgi:hypothetical protein